MLSLPHGEQIQFVIGKSFLNGVMKYRKRIGNDICPIRIFVPTLRGDNFFDGMKDNRESRRLLEIMFIELRGIFIPSRSDFFSESHKVCLRALADDVGLFMSTHAILGEVSFRHDLRLGIIYRRDFLRRVAWRWRRFRY